MTVRAFAQQYSSKDAICAVCGVIIPKGSHPSHSSHTAPICASIADIVLYFVHTMYIPFPTAATMSIFPLAVDAASARHSVPQTLRKYTANG